MRAFARFFLPLVALLLVGAPARAQQFAPGQYEEKLKSFDPGAVAAAQAYAKTFNMRGMMQSSAPGLAHGLTLQLKAKNPELNEEQANKFISAFLQSMLVDNGEVIEHAAILEMLDVFSREELEAVNAFYTSPVGAGVLKKMPILMGRMPQIMQMMQTYVIPRALEAAQAQMRKDGVEVKI